MYGAAKLASCLGGVIPLSSELYRWGAWHFF
jgi:hypothetical protein